MMIQHSTERPPPPRLASLLVAGLVAGSLLSLPVVAGCSSGGLPDDSKVVVQDPPAPPSPPARIAATCVTRNARCTEGGAACCNGFCDMSGYGWGRCVDLLADGEYCTDASQCRSKSCRGERCASGCSALEVACNDDGDCCGNSFCDNYTYAPWVCRALLPADASCYLDKHCASGRCADFVCAR
jgi:hypothetical protein